MTEFIFEGLRKNDFLFMIDEIISIDRKESKFGEKYITVSIRTFDKEVADEISRFLKICCKYVFDAEVSEINDEEGYYHIFIDVERNEDFPENLFDMLEKVTLLNGDTKWRAFFGGKIFSYPLTKENLEKYVNYIPKSEKRVKTRKIIENWFPKNIKEKYNPLCEILETNNAVYKIVCFGNKRDIRYMFSTLPNLKEYEDIVEERKVFHDFENEFQVNKTGDFFILESPDSTNILVIRKIYP